MNVSRNSITVGTISVLGSLMQTPEIGANNDFHLHKFEYCDVLYRHLNVANPVTVDHG